MQEIGYIAAFLTTISFLPQVYLTIKSRDTKSLSLSMYAIFVAGTCCWLVYGVVLNSVPMMIANSITVILSSIVLVMKIVEVASNGKISS